MAGSLPKFGRIDPALAGSEARAAPRPASSRDIDLGNVAAAIEPVGYSRPRRLKETPTRQSIEAVRLAEEETRLAALLGGSTEEVSQARRLGVEAESGTFEAGFALEPTPFEAGFAVEPTPLELVPSEAVNELYVHEMERALAVGSALVEELAEADPFGGLIPVEDEDPFGGLEPVYESDDDLDDEELAEQSFAASASSEVSRVALSPAKQIPRVLLGPREISKLPMDPRAAFILGHIDGFHSLEEIVDMCSMPEPEALELIDRLHGLGVIALR